MFRTLHDANGEYPRMVAVETTSRCNATCPFCPYNVRVRDKTHMTDELFAKIIEECREFPLEQIEPFLNGEPFVDPSIMDRLEMIRSRLPATRLRVYSNGYALAPKRIDELCGMGLDTLIISLNTLDPVKYETIMGLKLERTLANVKYLTDPVRRHKVAKNVHLRMTRMEDTTLEEQDNFIAFCKSRGIKPMIVGLFNYKGDINSPLPVPSYACEHITRLDILSNGTVTLCCQDQEGEYAWGDVNKQTVLEVYRGVVASRYRDMHRSGRRKEIEPCGTCNLFWPSADEMPIHKTAKVLAQAGWYFLRNRPDGRRPPTKVCDEHAKQIPDVPAESLVRPRAADDKQQPSN
jgi:hypothetical protein